MKRRTTTPARDGATYVRRGISPRLWHALAFETFSPPPLLFWRVWVCVVGRPSSLFFSACVRGAFSMPVQH
jgi:hypothetical protein